MSDKQNDLNAAATMPGARSARRLLGATLGAIAACRPGGAVVLALRAIFAGRTRFGDDRYRHGSGFPVR